MRPIEQKIMFMFQMPPQ